MHVHLKVRHWVMWWFYLGVVCGAVALTNIVLRNLSPTQVKIVLAFGVLHWALGGVVCYCCDGVKIETPPRRPALKPAEPGAARLNEWHPASDFILSGNRKSIMPPRY